MRTPGFLSRISRLPLLAGAIFAGVGCAGRTPTPGTATTFVPPSASAVAAAVSALRDAGGRPDDERPAPKELPAALGGRSGSIRVRVGTVVVGVVLLAIVVALVRAYAGG